MSVCALDNPDTMAREAWASGKLCYTVSANVLLEAKGFNGGDWFPFMLNYGDWKTGQWYGDLEAIPRDKRPDPSRLGPYIGVDNE